MFINWHVWMIIKNLFIPFWAIGCARSYVLLTKIQAFSFSDIYHLIYILTKTVCVFIYGLKKLLILLTYFVNFTNEIVIVLIWYFLCILINWSASRKIHLCIKLKMSNNYHNNAWDCFYTYSYTCSHTIVLICTNM